MDQELTEIVTWHLEMLDRGDLRRKLGDDPPLDVRRAEIPSPALNRFLYAEVGRDWHWVERLSWTEERWMAWLDRTELETWVGYVQGTPAGYFELELQPDKNVEIAYFGLLPQFIGQGLGGRLLTAAVDRAWATGANRVWVHTCSLDGPTALGNYQSRGFRVFKEETREVVI